MAASISASLLYPSLFCPIATPKFFKALHLPSIRMMGGGPRTFPGGVTKWQWKRMQEKKAKEIEKAKLRREREIYEMRRRAELLAATPQLEKPWEKHSRFRAVNRVTADEQIKRLASRFEKRGGEDLWNDEDGPVTFVRPDGQPSGRVLPPNAVHSTKMYERVKSSEAANFLEGQRSKAGGNSGYNLAEESSKLGTTEAKESMSKNFPSRNFQRKVLDRNVESSSEGNFRLDFSGKRRPRNANFK